MAVNVTVRDIVSFPGGTPKTVTVDVLQIVPVAGSPLEGDEIWISSATTAATASGGGSIQSIFKNEMKRGFVRGKALDPGLITIGATTGLKISIDEAIGSGVDITLNVVTNALASDIATDLEAKIKAQAELGGGGGKIGNLSYLNAQVRFENNRFQIESGTVSSVFTGIGRSSVVVAAPDSGTDARSILGLDILDSSESLASRQLAETTLATGYSSGDLLEVSSTAGFTSGSSVIVKDGTNSQIVATSGVGVADGLTASQIRFVTQSGADTGLESSYAIGSVVRLLHEVDVSDPVSVVTTVDQLYRFSIDSMVNQIDFSA
jgi:hypothetical protein